MRRDSIHERCEAPVVPGEKSKRPGLECGAVLSKKAAQCLTASDVQRGHDGERSAVADHSLEPRKARVRKDGDRAKYHHLVTAGMYSAWYMM
jgi:hypothetical protein